MTTLDHCTPTVLEDVPFVETTTGPTSPMPAPGKNPHTVSMNAASGVLGVGLAGLVWTALTQPQFIGWPIGAVLAMTVVTCWFALRYDQWKADNQGVCEFVRVHNPL